LLHYVCHLSVIVVNTVLSKYRCIIKQRAVFVLRSSDGRVSSVEATLNLDNKVVTYVIFILTLSVFLTVRHWTCSYFTIYRLFWVYHV